METINTQKCLYFPADGRLSHNVCGQLVSSGGFLHHRRSFEYHVLIAVTEGVLHITSDGAAFDVSQGEYILLRAGGEHFGHAPSEGRLSYMWTHFAAEAGASPQNGRELYPLPEYGAISHSERVFFLFRQLMELSLDGSRLSEPMADHALSLLVMELSREQSAAANSSSERLPAVILEVSEWIKTNYFRQFTVKELGEMFGYQADYLSTLFRRAMGITLVQYTNQIRIRSAKNLLMSYGLSVKETAYSCGFTDEKYFMRVFKEYEGVTPTGYKNAFREENR